jgi:hypothetical protein
MVPDNCRFDRAIMFNADVKMDILNILGCVMGKDGFLIYKLNGNPVLDHSGEKLHYGDFAGFCKGYGFIKSDIVSLLEYADWDIARKKEKEDAEKQVSKTFHSER